MQAENYAATRLGRHRGFTLLEVLVALVAVELRQEVMEQILMMEVVQVAAVAAVALSDQIQLEEPEEHKGQLILIII